MIGMKNKNGCLICISCVIVYTFRSTKTSSRIIQPVKSGFDQVRASTSPVQVNLPKTPFFLMKI